MKFREFVSWASDRAADGFWNYQIATVSLAIIHDVQKIPFWKRERIWKDKFENDVLNDLVYPVNKRIAEWRRKALKYEKHNDCKE